MKAGEPRRGLAWGGKPESLHVGNLWPRKERGDFLVPRGMRLRSPAHRVGRLPPPPGRGGGGVRPVTPASKPEPERTSHNATPYDPARIVQSDEGVGVRIHQRLSVVGRSVEHPSSAGGLDGGSDQYDEAGSLVIAERVAFDVPRVQSRRDRARQRRLSAASAADHDEPLRDRPSGDRTRRHAHDGTSRGAGFPEPAANLASSRGTANKMGQIASAVLAQPRLYRPHMRTRPLYGPGLGRRFVRREPGTHRSERRASGILDREPRQVAGRLLTRTRSPCL